ncbi:peptidylprolyl isomerase [Enemella evansiae]|uniref:peptidylprolyl isomerase n=1 Tax=Enemella evansiae TaxID=2016499 RepID=UPI001E320F95|nr:peptidylprolyl isomerase [Enemella evansiae]
MSLPLRVLAASAVVLLPLGLVGCAPSTPGGSGGSSAGDGASAAASAGPGGCVYQPSGEPARPVDPPSTTDVQTTGEAVWTLTTNQGPITITMDRSRTPCTVHSFESLAKQKYFDNTQCHRLVDSGIFVLQCGDPTGTGRGGPGYQFPDEVSSSDRYPAGTVAMANAGPDTNGSQFFLVYADSQLPPNYTVFGRMDQESLGVVARIAAEGQDGSSQDGSGKPNNEARIISVAEKS